MAVSSKSDLTSADAVAEHVTLIRSVATGPSHIAVATRRHHALILIAVCLGYFMAVLDATVVNVSLPDMARELAAGVAGMQWVVDGYALLFASLLLTAGALGDRLGNRGMFAAGIGLFTLASLLCGLAPSLPALVGFRGLQGIGAAIAVPASLALLRHHYQDPSERALAIGLWGSATGVAVAAGPVVGGILTHAWTWRSVFLVNIPIGIAGLVLTMRHVPPAPRHAHGPLDVAAQALGIMTLGPLTFGLIQGGVWGWRAPLVIAAFAVAGVAGALFYLRERGADCPMLPLGLFTNATFSAANAVGVVLNFCFYGEIFLMSLFFQQVQHRSPLEAGLALLPETAVISLMTFVSGKITARRGPRPPMVVGLALASVGLFGLALLGPRTPLPVIMAPLFLIGLSSVTMPAMTAAVLEHTPREHAGIGSAVLNASRQVGGVVGIALLGALISGHFLAGLRWGMGIAAAAALLGSGASLLWIDRSE